MGSNNSKSNKNNNQQNNFFDSITDQTSNQNNYNHIQYNNKIPISLGGSLNENQENEIEKSDFKSYNKLNQQDSENQMYYQEMQNNVCCIPMCSLFGGDSDKSRTQSIKSEIQRTQSLYDQSKLKKNKKYRKQPLEKSQWYRYLKKILKEDFNDRSSFYRYLEIELRQKFKVSNSRNDQQFLHKFSLESLNESQKIYQLNLKKYQEKYNLTPNDPFLINQLQIQLLEDLMKDTELMNSSQLSINFEQSIQQETTYKEINQRRQGLKSFLRAGSKTSFTFKQSDCSNYSALPYKKSFNTIMNNQTLIIDANTLSQNEKFYYSIHFYKTITKLIEKQLKMKNHPLGFIRQYFYSQFLKNYDFKKQILIEDMSDDINDFLLFYLDIIRVYYDLDQLMDEFPFDIESHLNQENLTNFLSCLLFSNNKFYNLIMYHISKEDKTNVQQNFEKNLKEMINKPIQFYEIPPDFQLNMNTIEYQTRKGNIVENIQLSDNSNSLNNKFDIRQKSYSSKPLQPPYQDVIQYFKKLDKVSTPLHKLKIIIKTTQLIDKAIKEFYSQNNLLLGKKVHYDADQFIALFVYIIVQSQSKYLYENCRLIDSFTYSGTLNSASGYLLVTLTGCVHHIASLNNLKKIDSYNVKESFSMNQIYNQNTSRVSSLTNNNRITFLPQNNNNSNNQSLQKSIFNNQKLENTLDIDQPNQSNQNTQSNQYRMQIDTFDNNNPIENNSNIKKKYYLNSLDKNSLMDSNRNSIASHYMEIQMSDKKSNQQQSNENLSNFKEIDYSTFDPNKLKEISKSLNNSNIKFKEKNQFSYNDSNIKQSDKKFKGNNYSEQQIKSSDYLSPKNNKNNSQQTSQDSLFQLDITQQTPQFKL